MSRTIKGSKAPGYEYWSRRAVKGLSPSSKNKRMTNRIERRVSKQIDGYVSRRIGEMNS